MAEFRSAAAFAEHLAMRLSRVNRSMHVGQETAAKEIAEAARRLLSGARSSSDLAASGHPYARRDPSGDPLPINEQSGDLIRSLRIFPRNSFGNVYYQLQFMSPHAKYVLAPEGTRRMIARGFWAKLHEEALPITRHHLRGAHKHGHGF